MMSDASPAPSDEETAASDDLVARIAAIDDYIAGLGGREALQAASVADLEPAKFSGLIDLVLLLRQSAAAGGSTPLPPPDAPANVGRYDILALAGEGGFSTVWEAFDPLLRRRVALKVRRADFLLSADARRRFIREAEIASRLSHQHIVTIYEVGSDDGREFIAQEYCAGGTLAAWLERHPGPLEPCSAARIVLALARAVAYAHGEGVVHRDIKPPNVLLVPLPAPAGDQSLLAAEGSRAPHGLTVKLADFGLGKVQDDESKAPLTQLTRTGASMGTPAWMAPEQIDAAFGTVGPATDVHALGLLLDRLLTGRMLRDGRSPTEAYRQALFIEAPSADTVARGVPRDLAAVCLACLAKRPAGRYASAAALAADLERWLDGKPTTARPLSALARAARQIARRPVISGLAAAAAVAGVLAGWAAVERASAMRRASEHAQQVARHDAAGELRRGYEALRTGNVAGVIEHLDKTRAIDPTLADSLASRWLLRRTHGEREMLLEPDASARAGKPRDLYSIALSPDGRTAAVAGADGTLRILQGLDGVPRRSTIFAHDEINDVCFSPDGRLIATVGQDGRARWWRIDAEDVVAVGEANPVAGPLYAVAFLDDGDSLALGGEDRALRIARLDAPEKARELYRFEPPAGETTDLESVAVLPNDLIAAACGDQVVLLDARDGRLVRECERPPSINRKRVLGSLTVSPDGRRLMACGTNRTAVVWDIATGAIVTLLVDHPAWVQGCCFTPDGSTLVTACRDGVIRLFAADSAALRTKLIGHVGRVWSVVCEPSGTLLSTGADGTVRRWDPERALETAMVEAVPVNLPVIYSITAGPSADASTDDRSLLALAADRALWRVPLFSGSPSRVGTGHPEIFQFDYDPVGSRLATYGHQFGPLEVTTFDAGGLGQPCRLSIPVKAQPRYVSPHFMPTGELVVATGDGSVFAFPPDLDRPRSVCELAEPVHAVVAAPTGPSRLAAAGRVTAIVTFSATSGRPVERRLIDVGEDSNRVAWSPDGGTVAVGTRTGRVLLFDAATGDARGMLAAHGSQIEALQFAADGRTLLSADLGGVRISDIATLATFDEFRPGWNVMALYLSPDDRWLVIAGGHDSVTPTPPGRIAVIEFTDPATR